MAMIVGELQAKLGLDFSQFTSGLKSADAALKSLAQQMSTMKMELPANAVKSFSDVAAGSNQLKASLSAALPVSQQLTMRLQEQQTQMGLLGTKLAEVSAKYGEDSSKSAQVQAQMQKLSNQINVTKSALDSEATALDRVSTEETKVGTEAGSAAPKVKSLGDYAKDALATAGGMLLAQGIQAVGEALASTVQKGIAFDNGMKEVFSLLPGISQGAMGQMSQQALDFSTKFGVLPEKVVPALYQSLSAGIPADNVFSFMATAQMAAKGGVTELKTSVDGISSVVNAYGPAVVSATQASDMMFTAVKLGKTNFDELSRSLFNVTPTAAALGVNFGDVTAALAAMTVQGVPTSVATTQLRQMFVELSKESSNTSKIFEKIAGETFKQFIASGHSTSDALNLMAQSANGSGKGINDLFSSVEAGSAALMLTGKGASVFADDIKAMAGSAGATQAAFDTMSGSLQSSLDRTAASATAFGIQLFTMVAPALTALVDGFNMVMGAVTSFASAMMASGNPLQFLLSAIDSVIPGFQDLANQAITWGSNIITQFTAGIMANLAPLISAMQYIGSVISSWLQPNSPPKITPNLDKWGAAAATVYYEGWSQGDYSALQEMGGVIQSTLNGMIDAGKSSMGKDGVIPMMLGSQGAISEAINQLNTTGSVGADAIQKIVASAGDAGPAIQGLVQSYFDMESATKAVADAQSALNSVTAEYAAKLDPLNAQLKALNDQQQAIKDKKKLEDLNKTIASASATEAEKENARIEIQKMGIQAQIKATEEDKTTAVNAAKVKLDAAKDQETAAKATYAAQKAQLDNYTKQNQLISQQTQLLKQMADAAKPKGGGGGASTPKLNLGGMKPDAGANPMEALAGATKPLQDISTAVDSAKTKFLEMNGVVSSTATNIQTSVAPVITFLQGMGASIQQGIAVVAPILANIGAQIQNTLVPPLMMVGNIIMTTVVPVFNRFVAQVQAAFSGQLPGLIAQFGGYFSALGAIFMQIQPAISTLIALVGASLYGTFVALAGIISGALPGALQTLSGAFQVITGVVQLVQGVIVGLGTMFGQVLAGDITGAATTMLGVWQNIQTGVSNIFSGLVTIVVGLAGTLLGGVAGAFDNILGLATGTFGNLTGRVVGAMTQLRDGVISALGAMYTGAVQWFTNLYETVVGHSIVPDMVKAVIAVITTMGSQFIALIGSMASGVISAFTTLAAQAITVVTGLATQIGATASQFLSAATDIGGNIISGIIAGVSKGIGALKDAVSNAAKSALDAAKSVLGIHSPSQVFADQVGAQSILGIVAGLSAQLPTLKAATQDLASEFVKDATDRLTEVQAKYDDLFKNITDSLMAFNSSTSSAAKGVEGLYPDYSKLETLKKEALGFADDMRKTQLQQTKDAQKAQEDKLKLTIEYDKKIAAAQQALEKSTKGMAVDETNPDKIAENQQIQADGLKAIADLREEYATKQSELDASTQENTLKNSKSIADIQDKITANTTATTKATSDLTSEQAIYDAALKSTQDLKNKYLEMQKTDPALAAKLYAEDQAHIVENAKMQADALNADTDGKKRSIYVQIQMEEQNHQIKMAQIQNEAGAEKAKQAQAIADIGDLAAQIESVFRGDRIDHFGTIGTQMAEGIAGGISSKMQTVKDALISGTGDAVAALKSYLGIHSPSTLFADTIGAPSIDGWAKGIDQNIGTLTGATINAGQASINAAGMTSGATTGAVGSSSIIYNISLDLSGSTLTRPEVEKILDTRMDKIAQTALRVRRA